jgi:hypothetical protein
MSRRIRAIVTLLVLAGVVGPLQTSHARTLAATDTLSGTININLSGNNQDVWQRLALDYEALHPKDPLLNNATGMPSNVVGLRLWKSTTTQRPMR